jgi:peptidoglycan/LPS O-acetylase OafA/YrhL
LNNLDILRAFAVTCVFIAHLFRHVFGTDDLVVTTVDELGRLGVLIFFVHTSLVLLMSLDRTKADRPWLHFYIRRLFRIYPLSITVIVIALVFRIPFMPDCVYERIGLHAVLSNLALAQNLTRNRSVIGPLWSLPYEVHMYVFLPIVHLILSANRSVVAALVVWGWTGLVIVLLLTIGIDVNLIQYMPCFLAGAVAYQIARVNRNRLPGYQLPGYLWPPTIVVLGALHVWLSAEFPALPFLSDYTVCLVLGLVIPYFNDLGPNILTNASRAIATYSYGIYLFHVPVMWFAFVCVPASLPIRWAAFAVLTPVIPWLSYHLLEAPFVTIGKKIADRWAQQTARVMEVAVKAAAR